MARRHRHRPALRPPLTRRKSHLAFVGDKARANPEQVRIAASKLASYDFADRTAQRHRSELRKPTGWHECTSTDTLKLVSHLSLIVVLAGFLPDSAFDTIGTHMALAQDTKFGVIGLGRLGAAVAEALTRSGYDVVGVSARSQAARKRAVERVPGAPVLTPAEVASRAEWIVLAVSDDAIPVVCSEIVAAGGVRVGDVVVHLSGGCRLDALSAAAEASAVALACHPAMTFAGTARDVDLLAQAPFGVTSLPEHRQYAEDFAGVFGGGHVWVDDDKRTLYHAAMVFAANNLIALTASAVRAMAGTGIPDPGAFLAPLLTASLGNTLRLGPKALTGPVVRGDTGTLGAHVEALRETNPDLVSGYIEFACFTAEMALSEGLNDAETLKRVIAALRDIPVTSDGD